MRLTTALLADTTSVLLLALWVRVADRPPEQQHISAHSPAVPRTPSGVPIPDAVPARERSPLTPLEGDVLFQVEEMLRPPDDPGLPSLCIRMWTQKAYPNSQYEIVTEFVREPGRLEVFIRGIQAPSGIAQPAFGAARATIALGELPAGIFELWIRSAQATETYRLTVSDSLLGLEVREAAFSKPTHLRIGRVPPRSFACLCEPTSDRNPQVCARLGEMLRQKLQITQVRLPEDALNPFGSAGEGTLGVFRYSDRRAFEKAAKLIAKFTASASPGNPAPSVLLRDWTGAQRVFWNGNPWHAR